jgi:hypothetical protein
MQAKLLKVSWGADCRRGHAAREFAEIPTMPAISGRAGHFLNCLPLLIQAAQVRLFRPSKATQPISSNFFSRKSDSPGSIRPMAV